MKIDLVMNPSKNHVIKLLNEPKLMRIPKYFCLCISDNCSNDGKICVGFG